MKSRLITSGIITLTVMGSLAVSPVMANSRGHDDDSSWGYGYRPGWGIGDKNHEHTGPPGREDDHPGREHPHGFPPGLVGKFDFDDADEFRFERDEDGDDSDDKRGNGRQRVDEDDDDDDRSNRESKSRGKGKNRD